MEKKINVKTFGYLEDHSTIIDNILKARNIKDKEQFLNPELIEYYQLMEIEGTYKDIPYTRNAEKIILEALENHKHFFLSVDSDTDGITSGAIMYKWLAYRMKENFKYSEPKISYWVSQGKKHGLSDELFEALEKSAAEILIVMDSLDENTEMYQKIRDLGVKIVVLDHHDIRAEVDYDSVVTLVSSNRSDNPYLSGAGVVWKFCLGLDRLLDDEGFTLGMTDLAAVGLIADMMVMTEEFMENRAIVSYGLQNLNSETLKLMKGIYEFNSNAIAFGIAPLINAACRYYQNDTAFEAFIEEDPKKIKKLIKVLKSCKERQVEDLATIKRRLFDEIQEQMDEPFFIFEIETEAEICGLLANQIMSAYQKPTFVYKKRDGLYKGSGRSYLLDLRSLTHECAPSVKGLGHPQAFGFICDPEYLDEFKVNMKEKLKHNNSTVIEEIDCELGVEDISDYLIDEVKGIDRITGQNFRPLRFLVETDGLQMRTMSQGKHLIFDDDNGFWFVKWNAGDDFEKLFEQVDDTTRIRFMGTLDRGFIGRKYNRRMIVDNYELL